MAKAMSRVAPNVRRVYRFLLAVTVRFALLFCVFLTIFHIVTAANYCLVVPLETWGQRIPCFLYSPLIGLGVLTYSIIEVGTFTLENLAIALLALAVAAGWAVKDERRHGSGWA
jgi:hypothetical protein